MGFLLALGEIFTSFGNLLHFKFNSFLCLTIAIRTLIMEIPIQFYSFKIVAYIFVTINIITLFFHCCSL